MRTLSWEGRDRSARSKIALAMGFRVLAFWGLSALDKVPLRAKSKATCDCSVIIKPFASPNCVHVYVETPFFIIRLLCRFQSVAPLGKD